MTLTTRLDSTIDRIGDWNPQLFRELKGRLTLRSLSITTVLVVVGYALTQIMLSATQPHYILIDSGYCQVPAGGLNPSTLPAALDDECPTEWINLMPWWISMNQTLFLWIGVILVLGVICGGAYLLINDLAKEKAQGTLNFIRFSPQSTRRILWGKLLGVPILLYVAIALALPFHLWLGIQGQLSWGGMLAFYGVSAIVTLVLFHLALLAVILSPTVTGLEAWLLSGVIITGLGFLNSVSFDTDYPRLMHWLKLFCPSILLPFTLPTETTVNLPFRHGGLSELTWYGLPIGTSGVLLTGFILLNGGFCLYWLDQALQRRFRNPTATVWQKSQAYSITGGFTLIWLGFILPLAPSLASHDLSVQLLTWLVYTGTLMLILVTATMPQRQPLIDWARYRHEFQHRRSLLRELLIGEHSPNFGVLLLMGGILLLPPVLINQVNPKLDDIIAGAVVVVLWLFAYTLLSYGIRLRQTPAKNALQANVLLFVVTCPLTIMLGLGMIDAVLPLYLSNDILPTLVLAIDSLLVVIGAIALSRRLRFWGESELQVSLNASQSEDKSRHRLQGRSHRPQ